ncbi:MAG TPA: hypothetical protein PK867_26075 [Pirellulales bacterium]|nr:hypothetical protein [Pirellulales bacterium]
MKWLLVIGALAAISCMSGCCQPGGLFSGSGSYGSYYSPTPYYSSPTPTYTANPCQCQ